MRVCWQLKFFSSIVSSNRHLFKQNPDTITSSSSGSDPVSYVFVPYVLDFGNLLQFRKGKRRSKLEKANCPMKSKSGIFLVIAPQGIPKFCILKRQLLSRGERRQEERCLSGHENLTVLVYTFFLRLDDVIYTRLVEKYTITLTVL